MASVVTVNSFNYTVRIGKQAINGQLTKKAYIYVLSLPPLPGYGLYACENYNNYGWSINNIQDWKLYNAKKYEQEKITAKKLR